MSLDASGTVGKTTTFSKWKGRNYVRLRVTPMNPQTADQQASRLKTAVVGHDLSFVLRPFGVTRGSGFYEAALAAAPAGQSWISYAVRTILGAGFSNIDGKLTAYAALSGTIHGYYDTASAALGLTDYSIAVMNGSSPIDAGAQLFLMVSLAVEQLGYTDITNPSVVTAMELSDFVDYVNTPAT